jgi:hypothetical protein
MAQIPTSSEIIRKQFCEGEFDEIMDCLNGSIEPSITQAMIAFTKLHVEKALKSKIEAMREYYEDGGYSLSEIDAFTQNSYPLSNIK